MNLIFGITASHEMSKITSSRVYDPLITNRKPQYPQTENSPSRLNQASPRRKWPTPLKLSRLNIDATPSVETSSKFTSPRLQAEKTRYILKSVHPYFSSKNVNFNEFDVKKSGFILKPSRVLKSLNSVLAPNTERSLSKLASVITTRKLPQASLIDKIELERQKSDKKLQRLKNHLAQTSRMPTNIKTSYFNIVKRLDTIRIQGFEDELLVQQNGMDSLMRDVQPNFELFANDVKIRNIEDIHKYKGKVLKVYDIVNNQQVWKRK